MSVRSSLTIVAILVSFSLPRAIEAHAPPSDTLEAITRLIESRPGDARLYLRRGEINRLEGHLHAAAADFERAARLDPSFLEVELSRAALLLELAEPERARESIERLLAREPDHEDARIVHAEAVAALGDNRRAIVELSGVIHDTEAPRPDLYLYRARLTTSLGQPQETLTGIEEGLARLGPVVTLELYAVDLETQLQRHDAALARIDRIAEQFDRKETIHARRGDVLLAAGRLFEAQVAYTEALDAIALLTPARRRSLAMQELEAHVHSCLRDELTFVDSGEPTP